MAGPGAVAAAAAVAPGVEQVVELFQNQRYRKFKVSYVIGGPVCILRCRQRSSHALLFVFVL